jgi:hypothetical protein
LRPQVEAAHIASRALTFVDAEGNTIGTTPVYDLTANEAGRDVELPRGVLTRTLNKPLILLGVNRLASPRGFEPLLPP